MASTNKAFVLHGTGNGVLSTSTSGSNVKVSIVSATFGLRLRGDWVMKLQRQNASRGGWDTIGTRSGYVTDVSPSHRTFTDVGKQGTLRVSVLFDGIQTVNSANFTF